MSLMRRINTPIVLKLMTVGPDGVMQLVKPIVFVLCSFISVIANAEDINAYDYLNNLRQAAGMQPFTYNKNLSMAAQNHANYLHMHRLGGHGERSGKRGFTGSSHVERILHTGYSSRLTGENVSYHTGIRDHKSSIDGLMGAIYHRFAFLSFKHDEIGIGSMESPAFSTHVYNFGNQRKNQLCQQASYNQPGQYRYSVCVDERFRIATDELNYAEHLVAQKNAEIIVWPADKSQGIPPAFYEEDPDPLPNHDVSGYPVSVQFNPTAFPRGLPVINRFEIFRVHDNQPIKTVLQLNANNDRSRKFRANEHALFPLHRLDWNTQYRVEVDYQAVDKQQSLSWVFTTEKIQLPMVTITNDNQAVRARQGETFAIYVPPRGVRDGKGAYQSRFPKGMKLDIQIYDNHTLYVTVTGRPGNATITFHGLDIRVVM